MSIKKKQKYMRLLIIGVGLWLYVVMGSFNAKAADNINLSIYDGSIDVEAGSTNGTIKITQDGVVKKDNVNPSTEIIIAGGTAISENTITVNGIKANITISNLNIEVDDVSQESAIWVKNGGELKLIFNEENNLVSSIVCSGIEVDEDSKILLEGPGKLIATGGDRAAGIGGSLDSGSITINGGTIVANGGVNAAGIGGGYYGSGGEATINGGDVTATGGYYGAGIGGGPIGKSGNVTINGGIVKAIAGAGAAGIGGGAGGKCETIIINGGAITATGEGAVGIGCGSGAYGGNITINGGTVFATEKDGGNGIGSGINGENVYIKITGGSIQAKISKQTPKDGTGEKALCATILDLGTVNANKKVGIAGLDSYGVNDLITNEEGQLYLWLTETYNNVSITVDEIKYIADIVISINSSDVKVNTATLVEAPVITSNAAISVIYGTKSTFAVIATGFPKPHFELTDEPDGVSIDFNSGIITIDDTVAVGTYIFKVKVANDFSVNVLQTFTLTVSKEGTTEESSPQTGDKAMIWLYIIGFSGSIGIILLRKVQNEV